MKLFSSVLAITSGLEIAKGLKKDVAENLDFFQTVQLRADHLFRDMIEMHRENVPDTDKVILFYPSAAADQFLEKSGSS